MSVAPGGVGSCLPVSSPPSPLLQPDRPFRTPRTTTARTVDAGRAACHDGGPDCVREAEVPLKPDQQRGTINSRDRNSQNLKTGAFGVVPVMAWTVGWPSGLAAGE